MEITKINDRLYSSPLLKIPTTSGKFKFWQINIEWNSDTNTATLSTITFINNEPVDIKKEEKDEKYEFAITISNPTIINKGKNIGRANETTVIQQAINEATTLMKKKIQIGYINSKDTINVISDIYYPMKLHDYNIFGDRLSFPLYVQPKFNGVRALCSTQGIWSNKKFKYVGFTKLEQQLKLIFRKFKNSKEIFLDGELYNHEMSLQQISGIVRKHKNFNQSDKNQLKLYIFDIIYKDYPFEKRLGILEKISKIVSNIEDCLIIMVPTVQVETRRELETFYKKCMKENYEGIVVRSPSGLYDASKERDNIRSYTTLKYKKTNDTEFEIVDITDGIRGKDVGAIIYICKTKEGNRFNAVPKGMTYEERYSQYKKYSKDKSDIVGKFATIQYDELSNNGTPTKPKFIAIRDYE
jgi:hypothetical protein